VPKNPDLEVAPTGGFNPRSVPPGRPTTLTADNSLYIGQLDYVARVSRAHTIWIDNLVAAPSYRALVLHPELQPVGTAVQVDFRGAGGFEGADVRPFEAEGLDAYGDPRSGSVLYLHGDPTWKNELQDLDGARYIQLRFSFENNVSAGFSPELSAVAVAFDRD